MKEKAARIFVIVSVGSLLAASIPDSSPHWLVFASACAVIAIFFGGHLSRVAGVLAAITSVVFAIVTIQELQDSLEGMGERQRLVQEREAKAKQFRQRLVNLWTTNGVTKSEAELIGEFYFHKNVGCGGFAGIRHGGDVWIVDGFFGYAALPVKNFQINKRTGKITSPIGPSYATPLQMLP